MIKRLIIAIAIALPMSIFAQKFGIVDADAVLKQMPEYNAMQTQIQDASAKYQQEFDKLNEEFEKKVTEYQTLEKDAATPQSIKERRIQEIQELRAKIEQFQNTVYQDLQRQQAQLQAPIEQRIMEAINSVGAEGGYVFIFPKGLPLFEGAMVEDCSAAVIAKLGIK